jgi:hypothetical protein
LLGLPLAECRKAVPVFKSLAKTASLPELALLDPAYE